MNDQADAQRRTVLLVDDHEVVRAGLRLLLERVLGYDVIEAGSAEDAVALATSARPDVVLLDARMPDKDGLWALERLQELDAELPVLMLSTYDSPEYVDGALDGGAAGYLLKHASSAQLGEAIRTALDTGGVYLDPTVAQRALARRRAPTRQLSDRENEVLALVAHGATNEEIAERLVLSEKTVKTHLSSIFRKLQVTNRTAAASKAVRDGLVG